MVINLNIIRKVNIKYVLFTFLFLFTLFLGLNYITLDYNKKSLISDFHLKVDFISQTEISCDTLHNKYNILKLVYKDNELVESPMYYPSAMTFDYTKYDEYAINYDNVSSFVLKYYINGDEVVIYKQNVYLGIISNSVLFNFSALVLAIVCYFIFKPYFKSIYKDKKDFDDISNALGLNVIDPSIDMKNLHELIAENTYSIDVYHHLLSYGKTGVVLLDFNEKVIFKNQRASFLIEVNDLVPKRYKFDVIQEAIDLVKKTGYADGEFIFEGKTYSFISYIRIIKETKFIVLYCTDISSDLRFKHNQTTFFNQASHELRSPLTSIVGYIELLKLVDFDREEMNSTLESCYEECRKMDILISSIIDLSKKFKKDELFTKTNISTIVVDNLKRHKGLRGITLTANIADNAMMICNPLRVGLILSCVINNAYEHNIKGGFVEINLIEARDGIEFSIKNSTKKLDEEEVKQVFEPFFKCNKESDTGVIGSGLGLCFVDSACKSYNYQLSHKYKDETFEIKILFYNTAPID